GQFRPVESLALALGRNGPILNRAYIRLRYHLLAMVDLVLQAQFFLVLAAADPSDNAHYQRVPVPWNGRVRLSHFDTSVSGGAEAESIGTVCRLTIPQNP